MVVYLKNTVASSNANRLILNEPVIFNSYSFALIGMQSSSSLANAIEVKIGTARIIGTVKIHNTTVNSLGNKE